MKWASQRQDSIVSCACMYHAYINERKYLSYFHLTQCINECIERQVARHMKKHRKGGRVAGNEETESRGQKVGRQKVGRQKVG